VSRVVSLNLKDDLFTDIFEVRNGLQYFKVYGAGEWIAGKEYMDVKSPIDLSIIAKVPKLSWSEVDAIVQRVYSAGRWSIRDVPGWKRLEILEKVADLMEKHRDSLVEVLVINSGKTRAQAIGEINASIDRLRRADLDARKVYGDYLPGDWDPTTIETEAIVKREPYGVVLAVIPFNYPLFDTVSKFAYSIVAGNAVIIKPSSADPLPVILFARLAIEAGVPRDSFAVITIPGGGADRLLSDSRIHVISFTGSSETGKKILASAGIKQFVMELGGGDPAIVLDDADLEFAAQAIAAGIYSYAGQRCDAVKLVIAEESIYTKLKELLIVQLSKVIVGDPRDEKTVVGPLIDETAADTAMDAISEAVKLGGRILYGGRRLGRTYIEPTLIEFLDGANMKRLRLYRDEVFAPVSLITTFKQLDEAIELANGRRYGLDASIFGYNIEKIRKLIRLLEFGAIYINDMPRHGVGYYPFGGRKESGIGREGIGYSIEYVTAYKSIIYNYRGKGVWRYTL